MPTLVATNWSWPLISAGGIGPQARNVETTELLVLTADSNDNVGVDTPHSFKAVDTKDANVAEHDRLGSARHFTQRFQGWRFGVLNFAACALTVFLVNLGITIWGSVDYKESQGILHEGDCSGVKRWNSGIHLVINVLSTVLLSGSNYCMQCLSAPTRREVNKEHAVRNWLDIGVPSLRNLSRISQRRLVLWLLLGLSSLPLHLLYNSAVYASISTNSYQVYLVSKAFLDDTECTNCMKSDSDDATATTVLQNLWNKSKDGSLDKLEPERCIADYATMIQSSRRNVLLVTKNENVDPSLDSKGRSLGHPNFRFTGNVNVYYNQRFDAGGEGLNLATVANSYRWMCSGLEPKGDATCASRIGTIEPQNWSMTSDCWEPDKDCSDWTWSVDYCLSEPAVPRCRLHFSPVISIVVTILNFFKVLLMFYICLFMKEDPLLTMGDAVASFLDEQDHTTKDVGLYSILEFRKGYSAGVAAWTDPRWRWQDVTSKKRRNVTLTLFASALTIVTALLIWGVKEIGHRTSTNISTIFGLGFGAVDPRAMIASTFFPNDMGRLALIANFPQVVLSFLYFAYNGLFTAMLMGYEWTSYAHKKKGLRISRKPTGSQRSTYFLQLPYRFALPLVILSVILHWLVSQSIFLVAFDVYDENGTREIPKRYSGATDKTCGYSPIAMLVVIILLSLMVAIGVGFGYIPYTQGMPLAGSCSLAISASCHPEPDLGTGTNSLSKNRLQWGVVSTSVDGLGHCAFSSKHVGPLIKGRMYA